MDSSISPLFLRTFRKAYELGNFTQTAKALAMTQSGVSQHIAILEETLGTSLFERVGRSVKPTKVGERFYASGGQWLAQMENIVLDIKENENHLAGLVSIGAPGSFGAYLLPYLLDWQKKNPELILNFEYGPNSIMERELRLGNLDIGICSEVLDSRFFVCEKLYDQEFILVSHINFPLKFHSWEDFLQIPMINYPGSETIFQQWIAAHFKKNTGNFNKLNYRAKINNMESVFTMIEKKVGATIFPSEQLHQFFDKKKFKPHITGKKVLNPVYLVQRQGQINSRRVEALKDLVIKIAKEKL